jgi:thiol-disulfide isomerase/thioredoxin
MNNFPIKNTDDIYYKKYLKYKAKYLKLNNSNKLNMQGGGNDMNTLFLFKADWCPHCRNFLPTWDKLKSQLSNKVNFVIYDSEKDKDAMKKFNIEGFPTIIYKVGDKAIEYVGPRDEASLKEFISQY